MPATAIFHQLQWLSSRYLTWSTDNQKTTFRLWTKERLAETWHHQRMKLGWKLRQLDQRSCYGGFQSMVSHKIIHFWDLSHYKPPIFWGPPSRLFGTPPVRTTQCSLSVKTGWFQSLWPPRFNSVQETFLVAASDGFWANGISGTTRQCFLCTIRCSIV